MSHRTGSSSAASVRRRSRPRTRRRRAGTRARRPRCCGRAVARGVGEVVGQQPVLHEARERRQDRARLVVTAGGEAQTREGDHRVPAPVVEPWVAGDDRVRPAMVEPSGAEMARSTRNASAARTRARTAGSAGDPARASSCASRAAAAARAASGGVARPVLRREHEGQRAAPRRRFRGGRPRRAGRRCRAGRARSRRGGGGRGTSPICGSTESPSHIIAERALGAREADRRSRASRRPRDRCGIAGTAAARKPTRSRGGRAR